MRSWILAVEVHCSYIVEFKLNSQSCHLAVGQINNSLAYKAATLGSNPTPNQSQISKALSSLEVLEKNLDG